jgi:LD-carboxypeptidase C-terminal domain
VRFHTKILTAGKTATEIRIPNEVVESLGSGKRLQGILQRIQGILVGRPGGSQNSEQEFEKYDAAVLKIAREFGLTDLPILSRMDFGHTDPKLVLYTRMSSSLFVSLRVYSRLSSLIFAVLVSICGYFRQAARPIRQPDMRSQYSIIAVG